ncbi:MAG: hypothetical protein L0J67_11440 [Halomonas sp.]|nr:hypothetical protein [Halomonas sp.]MDN6337225.1 hypothetical protein [Halomonas sp.]
MRERDHHDFFTVRMRPLKRLCNLDPPALGNFSRADRATWLTTDHQPAVESRTVLLRPMDMHALIVRREKTLGGLVVVSPVMEPQSRATSRQ